MTRNPIIPTRMWQWATELGSAGAARNAGMACRAHHDAHASLERQLARVLPAAANQVAA